MPKLTLKWSKLLSLTEENVKTVPNVSGIYRLSYKSSDGSIYVFYVDESDSLKTSLEPLLKKTTDNECVKTFLQNLPCYFRFAPIENKADKQNCVRSLYGYYSPKCNLKLPEGSLIDINYK